ncbi:MAG: hypothetical protein QXS38_00735 [Candidatus Pacearchaeota archaeon]
MNAVQIIKDFRNDLLKRREVKLIITADKNPGIQSALKTMSEHFKACEDCIVIKTLKSKFGRNTFLIDAFVYDSAADRGRIEPKKKEKKKAVEQTTPLAQSGGNK